MVRLEPAQFADACSQMCQHSGVSRTRLVVKLRPRTGTVYLRCTDDRTTLTSTLTTQGELKFLDRVTAQFIADTTAKAAVELPTEASTSGKKKKGGKK